MNGLDVYSFQTVLIYQHQYLKWVITQLIICTGILYFTLMHTMMFSCAVALLTSLQLSALAQSGSLNDSS